MIGAAMQTTDYLVHECVPLARGDVLRIEDGREMLVYAGDGCVWITQEGAWRDVMLKPGQSLRIGCGGRTLVAALRGSVLALASPYERCFARRIDLVPGATARAVPLYEAERGLRGTLTALRTRFMKAWVGLYAPVRSTGQIV